MEKRQVLEAFIERQKQKIKELKTSLGNTEQDAINSPGAMQSHSDTSKFQLSNLALGLKKRVIEAEESLSILNNLPRDSSDEISIGSFFVLEDTKTKNRTNYFLISRYGGEWIEVNGEEVLLISEEAPLINNVLGKRQGDKASFRDKLFEVVCLK